MKKTSEEKQELAEPQEEKTQITKGILFSFFMLYFAIIYAVKKYPKGSLDRRSFIIANIITSTLIILVIIGVLLGVVMINLFTGITQGTVEGVVQGITG